MFIVASRYRCSHRAFVSSDQLIELTTVTCRATAQRQRCGNKKLAVTLHGVGVKSPDA